MKSPLVYTGDKSPLVYTEIKNFWCKCKNRAKQKSETTIGGIHKFENNRQMRVNLAHIQFTPGFMP